MHRQPRTVSASRSGHALITLRGRLATKAELLQAPLLDPGWVSMCKGMDKEPALRRARATIRIARRWAPNPQVRCAADECYIETSTARCRAASHQHDMQYISWT